MQLASKFTWKFSRCKNKLRHRQGYILFKKFDFGPKNKKKMNFQNIEKMPIKNLILH